MNISLDISLYPLHENYEPPIIAFIGKWRDAGFTIIETPLSTQVYGPYDAVMAFLSQTMLETFTQEDMAAFNIRFVKGDRSQV